MADKMLKDLTKDTKAAASDSLMIWQGSNNARQISKADFLKEFTVGSISHFVTAGEEVTIPANAVKDVVLKVGTPSDTVPVISLPYSTPVGVYVKNIYGLNPATVTVTFHNTNSTPTTFTTYGHILCAKAPDLG